MRRTLVLMALVLLCAVVVPSALAHEDEEPHAGENVIYHTGTFEELGVLLKDLKGQGEPKKAASEPVKSSSARGQARKSQEKAKPAEPKIEVIKTTPTPGGKVSAQRKDKIKFAHIKRIIQNNANDNMYPTLKREQKPTIIHNTPLSHAWSAFDTWNFEYFAERWGTSHAMGPIIISNGTRSSGMHESVLIYANTTEYANWPGVPRATKVVGMNLGTFFSGQCQKETEDTWWWMRAMMQLNDSVVESQVQPMGYFVNPEARNASKPLASMVTSSMNGKLQLHYETDDMWIVNVYQRQQVLLFSPGDMQKLYLFPWTHPYRRRSQVLPLTDATDAKFPGISDVSGFEALMEPGEVLYIPKYWGYHIINVSPAIAVHVATPDAYENAQGQWNFVYNLVGLSHLSPAKRINAAIYAIRRVIQPLLDMDTLEQPSAEYEGADPPPTYEMKFDNKVLRSFIRKHVQQRYSKLPDYRSAEDKKQPKKSLYNEVKNECRSARGQEPMKPQEIARFSATLDGVVFNLYQHTDLDIRHLMMHDWLDFIAWAAFGDHNKMEAFLMRCF